MKYKVGKFVVDSEQRLLSGDGLSQAIRPKTLSLLLYLIEHKGQISSKQELLDNVWNDVSVDEGVIFQSIKELRKLFNDSKSILNHPRKGYELTLDCEPLNVSKFNSSFLYFIAALFVTLLLVFYFFVTDKESAFEHKVLILPVKNYVPYSNHDWVPLGAMDQLTTTLSQLDKSIYVLPSSHVLDLLRNSGLSRIISDEEIDKLIKMTNSTFVVETELRGNVYDYKLLYKVHQNGAIHQGVILEQKVEEAVNGLLEEVSKLLGKTSSTRVSKPQVEFNNALFAQAMSMYETDWASSISFFESYLTLNPTSKEALKYLAKLYMWKNDFSKANWFNLQLQHAAKLDTKALAYSFYLSGEIERKKGQWRNALFELEQANKLMTSEPDWLLQAHIEQSKGEALLRMGKKQQAISHLKESLKIFELLQSPIGRSSLKFILAKAYFLNDQPTFGKKMFEEAKTEITEKKIEFLYSMLEEQEKALSAFISHKLAPISD